MKSLLIIETDDGHTRLYDEDGRTTWYGLTMDSLIALVKEWRQKKESKDVVVNRPKEHPEKKCVLTRLEDVEKDPLKTYPDKELEFERMLKRHLPDILETLSLIGAIKLIHDVADDTIRIVSSLTKIRDPKSPLKEGGD